MGFPIRELIHKWVPVGGPRVVAPMVPPVVPLVFHLCISEPPVFHLRIGGPPVVAPVMPRMGPLVPLCAREAPWGHGRLLGNKGGAIGGTTSRTTGVPPVHRWITGGSTSDATSGPLGAPYAHGRPLGVTGG